MSNSELSNNSRGNLATSGSLLAFWDSSPESTKVRLGRHVVNWSHTCVPSNQEHHSLP